MSHARYGSRSAQRKVQDDEALPPITALFVVKFDQREGYKLIWSKSVPDVQLEGVVDFKSLPSGLHNVKQDLVYFIHNDYAGISAFVNVPADKSQRNAQMLAVGALVPLVSGRLGKSWRHAEGLEELAKEHISNADRLRMLEEYWEKNRVREGHAGVDADADGDTPMMKSRSTSSPQINEYRRPRGISEATASLTTGRTLSPHHPAISLPRLLSKFGPLIFPLYRAALLRKRILMVGQPPVEQNCNFVYALSILSSVPSSLLSLLPVDSIPPLRLRPLFNVGIQDIPALHLTRNDQADSASPTSLFPPSWIACTTDDVLATKSHLYDVLVCLPLSSYSSARPAPPAHPKPTAYPQIYPTSPTISRTGTLPKSSSSLLKATRRDFRRYLNLRSGLQNFRSAEPPPLPRTPPVEQRDRTAPRDHLEAYAYNQDNASPTSSSSASSTFSRTDELVEAAPWALIAYTSFIWWASAGEKKSGLAEDEDGEDEQDRALLMAGDGGGAVEDEMDDLCKEMAIVGYFHRLTSLVFATVSDAISRVDGERIRRDSTATGGVNLEGCEGLGILSAQANFGERDDGAVEDTNQQEEECHHIAPRNNGDDEDDEDENAPLLRPSKINATPKDDDDALENESSSSLDQPTVVISTADMTQMGLDVWSCADRSFVEELVRFWWGRTAVVSGGRVQCCGVRVL